MGWGGVLFEGVYVKSLLPRWVLLVIGLSGFDNPLLVAADRTIDIGTLRDKIKRRLGGPHGRSRLGAPRRSSDIWARIMPDAEVPSLDPDMVNGGFNQDDLYVAMPFVNAMKDNGVNCNWTKFGDYFRDFSPRALACEPDRPPEPAKRLSGPGFRALQP